MSQQPTTREELYERIRTSSKDEVILEEMIRLGFWPRAGELPGDPADEIRRRGELEAELRALRTEQARLHNVEAMKKEARKRRMAESRARRQETKDRKLRERAERAARWAVQQEQGIGFLGEGVSAGLNEDQSESSRLQARRLPELHTAAELAAAMGCSVATLRYLAFTRATSMVTHYAQFKLPKRSGGERLISAPLPRLKEAQYWILNHLLTEQAVHPAAHGFVTGRSIVSNAEPHVGQAVVVNLDLKDFFPTVTYRRVKGLFRSLGYSEALSTVLGLLCTEPRRTELELDQNTYHVGTDERFLPQGAPTSPAISNLICRTLDNRLTRIAERLGFRYTRYADDLSFSAQAGGSAADVGKLLRRVRYVVGQEGFTVHPEKTRVFRKGRRQEVTGIVVNQRCNVTRAQLKRFRATLFQIEKDGPEGKSWGVESGDVIAQVEGFANYVAMVNPEKGAPLQRRAQQLVQRFGKKAQVQKPKRQSILSQPTAAERRRLERESEDAAKTSETTPRQEGRTEGLLREPQSQGRAADAGAADGKSSTPESAPKKKPWWKLW